MELNLQNREIALEDETSTRELYSNFKDLWIKNVQYAGIPFPLRKVPNSDMFVLTNRWTFKNVFSHDKISDQNLIIPKPQRPDFPIAPKTVIHYDSTVFPTPIVFADVLRAIPPRVPMAAIRLTGNADGSVELSIPGNWPNYDLEKHTARHVAEVREWENDIRKYENDVRLWTEIANTKSKGCCWE